MHVAKFLSSSVYLEEDDPHPQVSVPSSSLGLQGGKAHRIHPSEKGVPRSRESPEVVVAEDMAIKLSSRHISRELEYNPAQQGAKHDDSGSVGTLMNDAGSDPTGSRIAIVRHIELAKEAASGELTPQVLQESVKGFALARIPQKRR